MGVYNPNQNNMVPPIDGAANPYGYDFWNKMRNSVYYEVPDIKDPYVFNYKGQDVRLAVGPYKEDPRCMKLSLVNRNNVEVYEISEHLRDAFHEIDWTKKEPGLVPVYGALCRDSYFEEDGLGVFQQLTDRHLCVPIYTPTGRIAVHRGYHDENRKPEELPEYLFDDVALRAYDKQGVFEYDAQVQKYDSAYDRWPGSDRSWALAMDLYYDDMAHVMRGVPSPDDYIGNPQLECSGDILMCVRNPFDKGDAYTRPDAAPDNRLMVERSKIIGGSAPSSDDLFERMVWAGIE